jgi:uncharacterized protein
MFNWKHSFYNINLQKEGYKNAKENEYYNILMGKFAVIPKDVDLDNPPEELKGFLVPAEVDESENYANAQKKAIENDYPESVSFIIAVTSRCNMRCVYCFEGEHNHGKDMSDETITDTITYIKAEISRNPHLKKFHIEWFGGETLINIKPIREISNIVIPLCKEKGIEYDATLITNGYLFTPEISEELKGYNVTTVQITLDGFEKTYNRLKVPPKGAYEQVLYNIEHSAIPIRLRLNTTRDTKEEILELAKELYRKPFVKEKNYSVIISRIDEYSDTLNYGFTDGEWLDFRKNLVELLDVESAVDLFKLPKAALIPCGSVQKRNVIVGADGYLYRCVKHFDDSTKRIGTVKDGVITNSPTNKCHSCSMIDEKCKSCKMLPLCKGGRCRYEKLLMGNKCYLEKERFRQDLTNYLTYVRG